MQDYTKITNTNTIMKINDLLQKPKWKRRMPDNKFQELTQDDFLNELNPSSHKINSEKYKSLRPKFVIDKETGKQKIVGYDDVERVSWAMEEVCLRVLTSHSTGNDIWFGNEGDETDAVKIKRHKSYWNIAGMKDAVQMWVHDAMGCGDSALYLYREDGKISYKVFSYLQGDIINKPNRDTFLRKFEVGGSTMVEVYDTKDVSTWVQSDEPTMLDKLRLILGKAFGSDLDMSEDGWKCIERIPHGGIGCPVQYLRLPDVVWGKGVSIRERIERLVSSWGDNNNYFAFPIFWFNGKAIKLPDMGAAGKAIGFTNSDGKAGILTPPDASTSFLQDLEKNMKAYCDANGMTMIDPKDLKGGDYTGAYLRNLYFTSVQWAQLMIAKLRPDITGAISLFLKQVGLLEGDVDGYKNVKMSWMLEPFVPTNKMEEITIINQCVSYGTTSVETATEEIAHNNPFEMDRLRAQREELGEVKTADPPVDNKAK